MTAPATMTAREVAALTGLSVASVYRGLARGEIPAVRVGARWIIYRARIEQWLADARVTAS